MIMRDGRLEKSRNIRNYLILKSPNVKNCQKETFSQPEQFLMKISILVFHFLIDLTRK